MPPAACEVDGPTGRHGPGAGAARTSSEDEALPLERDDLAGIGEPVGPHEFLHQLLCRLRQIRYMDLTNRPERRGWLGRVTVFSCQLSLHERSVFR